MDEGLVPLEKFVITKTLTKPPEDYPDAKNQPHVQVRCIIGVCHTSRHDTYESVHRIDCLQECCLRTVRTVTKASEDYPDVENKRLCR